MRNLAVFVGILFIATGIFGLSYVYHTDHRSAEFISDYADIDFKTSFDEDGLLEGAVFTMYDYRYSDAEFQERLILFTDGSPWEMKAKVKSELLPYYGGKHPLKHKNKLFAQFPYACLGSLKKAKEVRLRFYYDNDETIDLPLSPKDLSRWKMLLE